MTTRLDIHIRRTRQPVAALPSWLRARLHKHGRKFTSNELLQRITGSGLNPAPYLKYLKTKYGEIYGL